MKPRTNIYLAFIFLTGATTLSLELLASRIMTPYFGVSLYIWTGILSITLIALSLGYYIGGRLTGNDAAKDTGRIEYLFLLMPALSALAIALSCWLYPGTFADIASFSLVLGSFFACILLIFFPLIAVSAMNPLLIAMENAAGTRATAQGDSGSGRVFFISTVGSVVGVSVTAFVFIPNITNYNSLLLLTIALAVISFSGAIIATGLDSRQVNIIRSLSIAGFVVGCAMLFFSSDYLGKSKVVAFSGKDWTLQEEYSSLFGNTKVIKITGDWSAPGPDGKENYINLFLNDGTIMNTVDSRGRSRDAFTYALEYAALGLRPDAKTALILGLGVGVVPTRMANKGIAVDVVEINPDYLSAAINHFGFDSSVINVVEADARTFVRACDKQYDVVVIDLFQGDGVPDYLLSREFFEDVAKCMTPDAVASFNTLASTQHLDAYYHIIKTVQSVFPEVLMFHQNFHDGMLGMNIYLAVSRSPLVWNYELPRENVAPEMTALLREVFTRNRPLDQARLAQASIIRDEFNVFSILNNEPDRIHRQATLNTLPAEFFVN